MDLHKIEEELDYHENIRCMDERILRAELDAIERDRRGAKNDKIALAVGLGISLVGVALATWLAGTVAQNAATETHWGRESLTP